jgi:hypothetical protein
MEATRCPPPTRSNRRSLPGSAPQTLTTAMASTITIPVKNLGAMTGFFFTTQYPQGSRLDTGIEPVTSSV